MHSCALGLDVHDGRVVLDDRERLVEVMEQRSPFLVLGRAPETFGVILETFPFNSEQVTRGLFEATVES